MNLSRPLEQQEQLDLSRMGQDKHQNHAWYCGWYIRNYRMGMGAGCQNIPDEPATCLRLWHY